MELGRNKAHEMQRFGFPHLQVPAVYIKEHSSLTNLKGNTLIDQNEVGQSGISAYFSSKLSTGQHLFQGKLRFYR